MTSAAALQCVIKTLSKKFRKADDRKQSARSDFADCVAEGIFPAYGLRSLQAVVMAQVKEVGDLYTDIENGSVIQTIDMYNSLLGTLVASFWSLGPMGRQRAVAQLECRHGARLLAGDVVLSSEFKTEKSLGYQPIAVSALGMPLLHHYLVTGRPWATDNAVVSNEQPLFVSSKGKGLRSKTVGRIHSAFYLKHCDKGYTINTVRKLVETAAAEHLESGAIDATTREAICNVSGHTLNQASKTYVKANIKKKRSCDMEKANGLFAFMLNDNASVAGGDTNDVVAGGDTNDEVNEITPQIKRACEVSEATVVPAKAIVTGVVAIPVKKAVKVTPPKDFFLVQTPADAKASKAWGTQHPSYEKVGRTIEWSTAEVNHIGRFVTECLRKNPEESAVYSQCLKSIIQDDDAIPIFHPHHIANSDRVKNGYISYQKYLAKQIKMNSYDV